MISPHSPPLPPQREDQLIELIGDRLHLGLRREALTITSGRHPWVLAEVVAIPSASCCAVTSPGGPRVEKPWFPTVHRSMELGNGGKAQRETSATR